MSTTPRRKARLAALLLLLAAATPAFAAMQAQPVAWSIGDDAFSGYLVYDDASSDLRPGLVMVPNWMGVTDEAVAKARQVAGDDYVVLLADVYGRDVRPKDAAEAGRIAGELRNGPDRAVLQARMDAALDALKAQAGSAPLDVARLGAVGFCFGGSAVLELVRMGRELGGVVSLHGGLATPVPAPAGSARTPLLVLNGAADTLVSREEIDAFGREMDAAGADWQFVNFGGAVHCFAEEGADSPGCTFDPLAARRAAVMMENFFDQAFTAD